MDSEKSQKLWPKYSKGDRGIFVRGIISEDECQARIVISSKYEDDDEVRRYVRVISITSKNCSRKPTNPTPKIC